MDNTIKVAKKDLEYEVDYVREANNYEKFASLIFNHKSLSKNFVVPKVFRNFSSKEVLVTEFQNGIPLSKVDFLNQVVRDKIGENMLRLCLSELFEFKQMQTGNMRYS